MEFVAIVAVVALLQYIGFGILVGRARGRYGVHGPAVTGHPIFERYFRVQMNTLELLIACCLDCCPRIACARVGRAAGRVPSGSLRVPAQLRADPAQRGVGFGLGLLPIFVLLLGR
jgi:hypothetical protein